MITLTVLGIVFRSELAILLATHTVYVFLQYRVTLSDIIYSGLQGVLIGLSLTVPVDSFFWQTFPAWPEFQSFYFNVVKGKSSDWGTSPFFYYFTNALPKLLSNPLAQVMYLPMLMFSPAVRGPSLDLLIPNLAFILIYSFQPHKEWRFIIYTIPPLTAVCAREAAYAWDRRVKSLGMRLLAWLLVASTFLSIAYSFVSTIVSSLNYPGAVALNRLHALHARPLLARPLLQQPPATVAVHMDVLTCQTGATLFLQRPSDSGPTRWTYDKTDSKTGDGTAVLRPDFWARFDYALAEDPARVIGHWDPVDTVYSYGGVTLVRPGEAWGFGTDSERAWEAGDDSGFQSHGRAWGEGPWVGLAPKCRALWVQAGRVARIWVTRGWWVDVHMVPIIRILRRVNADPNTAASTSGRIAAA